MTATKYKRVFYAAPGWLEIATGHGLKIDWDSNPITPDEWDSACEAAGFNPDDHEVAFGTPTRRSLGALGGRIPEGIAGYDGADFVVIQPTN